jgi:DNA repair protein RecN (Recombination protein N)
MLVSLAIQNVVLIDRLNLEGGSGLCALTGETGAGKSILLDALGLALGARAEARLVRHGEDQAMVTACFDVAAKHPVLKLLQEKDIIIADTLILRRTLGKDGRSKAFINDAPVSVQLLKEVGACLVEIHGQFETQGLLDPATHGAVLDAYAGIADEVSVTRKAWQEWRNAQRAVEQAVAEIGATRLQEEYLTYTVAELEKLCPLEGEEAALAAKRSFLMNREKMQGGFEQAEEILEGDDGLQTLTGRLQAVLERMAAVSGGKFSGVIEALLRAKNEIEEVSYQLGHLKNGQDGDAESLEDIENRYFALRDCAKKHKCTSDDLPRIYADLKQRLHLITHQDDALAALALAVERAKKVFIAQAEKLSAKRQKAAQKLTKAVNAELPDLKLDKAKFMVECVTHADEKNWHAQGFDSTQFTVSTNPNTPLGALHKIASGGELSRFMLALKLILAETSTISTLIFDEVDSGIGGATADAVGIRLARLSRNYQVLVVTHSPQVAALAGQHWIVAKTEQKGAVLTKITALKNLKERQEEIARMLSGAKITAEARAAAAKLLENQNVAA